jgi:hypothetical protein
MSVAVAMQVVCEWELRCGEKVAVWAERRVGESKGGRAVDISRLRSRRTRYMDT